MWVIEIVFAAYMGTKKDKNKLDSDMIGVYLLAIKKVLNTFADSLPCIYLFQNGTVKIFENL